MQALSQAAIKHKESELEEVLAEVISQMGEFLSDEYQVDLVIPVSINARLTKTLGRFIGRKQYDQTRTSVGIELSKQLFLYNEIDVIVNVALHEAVHYALFELGLPYRDGEEVFENELKKHSLPSNYYQNIDMEINKPENILFYACGCEGVLRKRRRALLSKHIYRCVFCKEPLHFHKKERVLTKRKIK